MIWRFTLLIGLLFLTAGCAAADLAPAVLFLRPGPAGAAQLYLQPAGAASARQLTGVDDPAAPAVIDYAAAPDGERIVYAVLGGAADSALRIIDGDGDNDAMLLNCPAAECSGPVWSPDGRRLIYERRPQTDGRPGSPRLHWLDPATGETRPLIEGKSTPGYGARFSPDGQWLSYVSPADEGVVLYHLSDGAQRLLSSRVGSPAAFSPDSAVVVYGDISVQAHDVTPENDQGTALLQESASTFLYRTHLDQDSPRQRLSPDAAVADSVPAFSPDGQWIAFGRAPAGTDAARQLWLMRPDGGQARALTADPAASHGPPSWSADGRYLLFQRYAPAGGSTSVWRLEAATGEAVLLAEGGYLPGWLPPEASP
ncbi:MAG: PD40 domain-containing protein [Candidatus Promineofilum sp.]|nr:PD40 domain-containing protein [Promineifilum sp.]